MGTTVRAACERWPMNVRVLFAQGDVSVLAIAKLLKLSLKKCAPAGHVSFSRKKGKRALDKPEHRNTANGVGRHEFCPARK